MSNQENSGTVSNSNQPSSSKIKRPMKSQHKRGDRVRRKDLTAIRANEKQIEALTKKLNKVKGDSLSSRLLRQELEKKIRRLEAANDFLSDRFNNELNRETVITSLYAAAADSRYRKN